MFNRFSSVSFSFKPRWYNFILVTFSCNLLRIALSIHIKRISENVKATNILEALIICRGCLGWNKHHLRETRQKTRRKTRPHLSTFFHFTLQNGIKKTAVFATGFIYHHSRLIIMFSWSWNTLIKMKDILARVRTSF